MQPMEQSPCRNRSIHIFRWRRLSIWEIPR
nr:MAG TPA: hypothetical protein [Caudoviricetes sp.]